MDDDAKTTTRQIGRIQIRHVINMVSFVLRADSATTGAVWYPQRSMRMHWHLFSLEWPKVTVQIVRSSLGLRFAAVPFADNR